MSSPTYVRWNWRKPSWNSNSTYSTIRRAEQPREQHHDCFRCGHSLMLSWHRFAGCPALTEKCLKCSKVGHFARKCFLKKLEPKMKSTKRKQRDMERLSEYNKSKALINEFPFSNMTNDELSSCFDKHQTMKEQYIGLIQYYEKSLQQLEEDDENFVETNLRLEVEVIPELENKLRKEHQQRQTIEQELRQQEQQNDSLKTEFKKLKQKYDSEICANIELMNKCGSQMSEIHELKQERKGFENELKRYTAFNTECNNFLKQLTKQSNEMNAQYESVKLELINCINVAYQRNNYRPPKQSQNFSCRKCGSDVYHPLRDCWARNIKCGICGKFNHLSAMCKDRVQPVNTDAFLARIEELKT